MSEDNQDIYCVFAKDNTCSNKHLGVNVKAFLSVFIDVIYSTKSGKPQMSKMWIALIDAYIYKRYAGFNHCQLKQRNGSYAIIFKSELKLIIYLTNI